MLASLSNIKISLLFISFSYLECNKWSNIQIVWSVFFHSHTWTLNNYHNILVCPIFNVDFIKKPCYGVNENMKWYPSATKNLLMKMSHVFGYITPNKTRNMLTQWKLTEKCVVPKRNNKNVKFVRGNQN